ncbi:MAG: DegT/DnrJ/EryC1/StrS family aminotransferase [Anaerolineae bacterium]
MTAFEPCHPNQFGANREDVRLALERADIESRSLWKPMHMQPIFRDCDAVGGTVAENLFHTGLCLPSGTALSTAEQDQVIDIVRQQGK